MNGAGIELSEQALGYLDRFTGTMIVLGMMMIGSALAQVDRFRFDWSFFGGVFLLRYLLWPLMGVAWVWLDATYLQLLPSTVHTMIILICACPLAANTVAYATKLNLFPALTACMVLLTTFIALLFMPFMIWFQGFLFG